MIVAIQRGLDNIKHRLEAEGMQVVYYDLCQHPVDAYIYQENLHNESDELYSSSHSTMSIHHGPNATGMLYINASGKSYSNIKRELSNIYKSDFL